MKKVIIMTILLLFISACNVQGEQDGKGKSSGELDLSSFPVYELTDSQVDSLMFMWEEEKLARDVYITLANDYGEQIFSNISRSEQKHMDAVAQLIEKYDVPQIGSNAVGVFTSSEFQNLYYDLINKGRESLSQAYQVGLDIENLDIKDLLERILGGTPDMQAIYENLLNGSYKHLNAFQGKAF